MSKTFYPLVTVGVPIFQGEKFLEESLPSICRQSYPNLEIIVIDDNSTDNSFDLCKKIHNKFKNFKLILNKNNLGAWDNFKKILQKSKGEYFCWACQDDFFDEKFIEKQVDVFLNNKDIIATLPSYDLINYEKRIISTISYKNFKLPQNESKIFAAINLFRSRKINGIREKNNMFIHGLIKKNKIINIVKSYDGIIFSERAIVFFLALVGRLYFIEEKLWKRTYRGPLTDREDRIKDPYMLERRKLKFPFFNNIRIMIIITLNNNSLNIFNKILSLKLIFLITVKKICLEIWFSSIGFIRGRISS